MTPKKAFIYRNVFCQYYGPNEILDFMENFPFFVHFLLFNIFVQNLSPAIVACWHCFLYLIPERICYLPSEAYRRIHFDNRSAHQLWVTTFPVTSLELVVSIVAGSSSADDNAVVVAGRASAAEWIVVEHIGVAEEQLSVCCILQK